MARVWNSVRHAQAQGLARRIFSAASRVPATELPSKSNVLEAIFCYVGAKWGVILDPFRGHFGGLGAPIWGSFWGHFGGLGGSGAPPGSWALSDHLWGRSWAPPGRSWGPSWGPRWRQVGPKLALKSVQEASKMDPKTRPLSEGRWNAKMEPKWELGTPK